MPWPRRRRKPRSCPPRGTRRRVPRTARRPRRWFPDPQTAQEELRAFSPVSSSPRGAHVMTLCSARMSETDGDGPRHTRLVSLPLWVYRHRRPILLVFGGLLLSGVGVLAHFNTRVAHALEGRAWSRRWGVP